MCLNINFKRLKGSFNSAFLGIKTIFKEEQNFKIMFAIGLLALVLMIVFDLSLIEKAVLILTIFFVLAIELINSATERIVTLIHRPEIDLQVKKIKDILAGVSLFACFGAVTIAILILLNNLS